MGSRLKSLPRSSSPSSRSILLLVFSSSLITPPFVLSLGLALVSRSLKFGSQQLAGMLANIHSLPPLLIPQYPTLSEPDPPNEVSILSSPLFLVLLIALGLHMFFTISADRFDETLNEDKHSEALTALMAIFTPTRSSWPRDILDATRRASSSRLGRPASAVGPPGSGSGFSKGEIRLRFSTVYEHILNGNLELQPTASVDLVKAILLERDGMEVDGWRIKVVVEWKWVWKVSLWIMQGLGPGLMNLSELWNDDVQKVILNSATEYMRFVLTIVGRLHTCWVRCPPRVVPLCSLTHLNRTLTGSFPSPDLCPRFTPRIPTRQVRSTFVQGVTIWPLTRPQWRRWSGRKTCDRDFLYNLSTLSSSFDRHSMRTSFLPPYPSHGTYASFT